jgi:hypothetical protein
MLRPHSAAGWLALALLAGIAVTGCSPHGGGPGAARYLDVPFSHQITVGAVTITPPATGELPLVPLPRAREIALHPDTWLRGASHSNLVAFGYGRVETPTDTANGQAPFRSGRLAWVAIYSALAANLVFNGCLGGPPIRRGYHLVPGDPQPAHFYLAVVIDAITGVQVTAMPLFHNVCPHLIRDPARPGTGTITRI